MLGRMRPTAAGLPKLYVMDVSYFSGKVEAYVRYQGVAHERVLADLRVLVSEVGRATGVFQVPAMRLADGGWLRDSTAILRWFEAQPGTTSVTPAMPADAFLAALIEDYCDEWLWRPAMWWRWVPETSRRFVGRRIAREVLGPIPLPTELCARTFAARQRQAWLEGDGMHPGISAAIRDMYREELATLDALLADRPFLLGAHPSLVDFGYFGPMFRHFACDPDPLRVMQAEAPRVHAWVERLWAARAEGVPETPRFQPIRGPAFDALLGRIARRYLPYLRRNAEALRDGERRFDLTLDFGTLRGVRTHRFRVACRNALRRAYAALAPHARDEVQRTLAPHGGLGDLVDGATIRSGLDEPLVLPIYPPPRTSLPDLARRLLASSFGREPSGRRHGR